MCTALLTCPILLDYYFWSISPFYRNELIHWVILFLAIPISVYALVTGVSNHNDYVVFLVGLAGLGVLVATALSESYLSETSIIIFTLMGSALVVYAHTQNFQLCKELDCDCHDVV